MVTPDVSEQARDALRCEVDEVIEINYIKGYIPTRHGGKRFKSMYQWLENSYTKFSCFKLVQFEKVLFFQFPFLSKRNKFINKSQTKRLHYLMLI